MGSTIWTNSLESAVKQGCRVRGAECRRTVSARYSKQLYSSNLRTNGRDAVPSAAPTEGEGDAEQGLRPRKELFFAAVPRAPTGSIWSLPVCGAATGDALQWKLQFRKGRRGRRETPAAA